MKILKNILKIKNLYNFKITFIEDEYLPEKNKAISKFELAKVMKKYDCNDTGPVNDMEL